MKLQNDLLLKAAKGEKTERIPIWLMRQAGRILPEYLEIRNKLKDFKELVKSPLLATEVTIQPVDILGVDAAIIFSDILVIPEAMGLNYEMVEKKGPYFPTTVHDDSQLKKLHISDGSELQYVFDAIELTKKELNGRVPLIGFGGAPWTIMAYMVEGTGSKTFSKAKKMLYSNPQLSHQLLEMITQSTINYFKQQIKSGVDIIQIFDSWAGLLSPEQYQLFSLQYIEKIVRAIGDEVTVTVFAKGAWFALEEMNNLPCHVVGIDWTVSPDYALKTVKNKTIQGNLDPCVLYGTPEVVQRETIKMLEKFKDVPYIANLGHGVYPDTDKENVKVFIETVKNFKI